MTHRISARILPLATLVVIALGSAEVDPKLALGLVPVFVVFGLLALGHFPGEEIIERLRRTPPPPRRSAVAPRTYHAPFVRRVGRATAFALSVRPPPAALAHR